ncbi:hypothetical protein JG687_00010794 [Phytophthora cactorum]|uniref:ZSWIM1/3 RNaseH-like domain-containing protein n=1 Tax=Phytophthora cactorum TaxID=29920 RepID=A0A8T1UA43_9STRA|nr:hypothetical protein JG687_00010794 [Phytophthora cactorum]
MQDVHNVIARIHGDLRGEAGEDAAVAEFLLEFNSKDFDNVPSVNESENGATGAISLTISHMRQMFREFPELLMIDCTQTDCRSDNQLCSLMIMDSFGAGLFVQHSIIEINSEGHLHKVIDHF